MPMATSTTRLKSASKLAPVAKTPTAGTPQKTPTADISSLRTAKTRAKSSLRAYCSECIGPDSSACQTEGKSRSGKMNRASPCFTTTKPELSSLYAINIGVSFTLRYSRVVATWYPHE
jgi:hypothetical protein